MQPTTALLCFTLCLFAVQLYGAYMSLRHSRKVSKFLKEMRERS